MKPNKEEQNAKYYNLNTNKPEAIMEDFFREEEKEETKRLKDEGFVYVGSFDKDTSEEELDALFEKMADMTE